jgi:DNA-binding transcriptional LysR family regulator
MTLGSTAVLETCFLPRIIGRFSKQYPGIDIDLRMGNSQSALNGCLKAVSTLALPAK